MRANVHGFFLLLFFYFFLVKVRGEIFPTIDRLKEVAEAEVHLLEELRTLAKQLNNFYSDRKLEQFEEEHILVKEDMIKHNTITNPLNAYLLIQRWTLEALGIYQKFPERSEKFMSSVNELNLGYEDLVKAVKSLLDLQTFYGLNSEDLAKGIIDGTTTRKELSALDLHTIGEEAFKMGGYDHLAKEYLQMTREMMSKGQHLGVEVSFEYLLMTLVTVYDRVEEYDAAIVILDGLIPQYQHAVELKQKKDLLLKKKLAFVKDRTSTIQREETLASQICQGKVTMSLEKQAALRCRFVFNSAYSKLLPAKAEEVNLDPYLVIFVDVLTDDEIVFLKTTSESKVDRKKLSIKSEQFMTTEYDENSDWLYDNDHKIVERISKKAAAMTGLSEKSFEPLQVLNYGIGVHNELNWDHTLKREFSGDVNRKAFLLFYLSDVEKGGETIWPDLTLRVAPRKGSSLFWYNLKSSGIHSIKHANCPVLLGSKWIANKWIRED